MQVQQNEESIWSPHSIPEEQVASHSNRQILNHLSPSHKQPTALPPQFQLEHSIVPTQEQRELFDSLVRGITNMAQMLPNCSDLSSMGGGGGITNQVS